MQNLKNDKLNIIIGMVVLILYTVMATTHPNFMFFDRDEIHAINIAKNFNFFEILDIMRAEGHTFLWYMIIKPFVSIKALSPWIIKVINFLFMLTSVALLWFKAPFKTITKVLIIFSFPFLYIYSTFARCYGIGILLLFILTILYEKKLRHPILYPLLIFLTANTSLMACAGAGAFGILYYIELFKEKNIKNILIATGFCLLTIFILIYQWHDPIIPEYITEHSLYKNLQNSFPYLKKLQKNNGLISIIILFCLSSIASFKYFIKHKSSLIFIIFSSSILIITFKFIYPGFYYHHYFFYVYLIIAFWLSYDHISYKTNEKKIFAAFFCILSLILVFTHSIQLSYHYQIVNYDYFPNRLKELIGTNKTIYTQIYSNDEIVFHSDIYNLKDFEGKPLIKKENFLNTYKNFKPIDLKKLVQEAEPNSYLIVGPSTIKNSINYNEFSKKHKPIAFINWLFIYKLN